jgi:hypothetical protein
MATPALLRAAAMARTSRLENRCGQTLFENKCDDHVLTSGPGNGQIVHGPVHSKLANGAAGKLERLYYKAVGGNCDSCAVDPDMRGVAQRRFCSAYEQERRKQTLHESAAGLAAGAVRHLDLRVAKANIGGGVVCASFTVHAAELMVSLPLLLPCDVRNGNKLRMNPL